MLQFSKPRSPTKKPPAAFERKSIVIEITQFGVAFIDGTDSSITDVCNYMLSIKLSHCGERGKNFILEAIRQIPGINYSAPVTDTENKDSESEEEFENAINEPDYTGPDAIHGIHRQLIAIKDNRLNFSLRDVKFLDISIERIIAVLEPLLSKYFIIEIQYGSPAIKERSTPSPRDKLSL